MPTSNVKTFEHYLTAYAYCIGNDLPVTRIARLSFKVYEVRLGRPVSSAPCLEPRVTVAAGR